MRWKATIPPPPIVYNIGDTRITKTWLILPTKVGWETRWLEWAFIEQVYVYGIWFNRRWID